MKKSMLSLWLVFASLSLYAQPAPEPAKGIYILPLEDYTNAGKLYRDYIPLRLKEILSERSSYPVRLVTEFPTDILKAKAEYNAKAIVTGRIIKADDVIRLRVQFVSKEENLDKDFEVSSKTGTLPALDELAERSASWLSTYVISKVIPEFSEQADSGASGILLSIRRSPAGIILKNKWLLATLLILGALLASWLLMKLSTGIFLKITSHTENELDDRILEASRQPLFWIINLFGLKLAALILDLPTSMTETANDVLTAGIIFLATVLIVRILTHLLKFWGEKLSKKIDSRIDDDLIPLLVKITRIVLYLMGILLILSNFGIQIAPLLASLGIAGFAFGFAVKDSLANVIGGIILILDESFVVGDKVSIDGDTGVILEVGLRNTKLRTFDNEIIVIPNGDLMNKKFKNYALPDPQLRVVVPFSVAYGTNIDRVKLIILDEICSIEDIADEPEPTVEFVEMGESALNFVAKFWVDEYSEQYSKKLEAIRIIYETLKKNGFEIPYPTRTVYLEQD